METLTTLSSRKESSHHVNSNSSIFMSCLAIQGRFGISIGLPAELVSTSWASNSRRPEADDLITLVNGRLGFRSDEVVTSLLLSLYMFVD